MKTNETRNLKLAIVLGIAVAAMLSAAIAAATTDTQANLATEILEWTDHRDGKGGSTITYECTDHSTRYYQMNKEQLKRMQINRIMVELDKGCSK